MILSFDELKKKYKTNYKIKKAMENKEIFKLENGVYSDKRVVDPLIIYSKKYPSAVITMDSAFYYYNLTDVIPNKVYLATVSNYRTIHNDKIVQVFMNKDILNVGKTVVLIDGEFVNIYDKERLLVELIRKRKQIPFDYYKEIIINYREIVDELDMHKIEQYVALFKNEINLFDLLQREVF